MGSELRIELKSVNFVTLCYCCLFNFPQHTFFLLVEKSPFEKWSVLRTISRQNISDTL